MSYLRETDGCLPSVYGVASARVLVAGGQLCSQRVSLHSVRCLVKDTNGTVRLTPPQSAGPLSDTSSTTLRQICGEPKAHTAGCQRVAPSRKLEVGLAGRIIR